MIAQNIIVKNFKLSSLAQYDDENGELNVTLNFLEYRLR